MTYLVTGGAGFIGSHVVDALAARGDEVIALDDLSTGRRENLSWALESGRVRFVEGSILDAELVDECMRASQACIHLASAVGVKLIIERPLDSLLRNVRGTDVVVSAATRHRRRLLFSSSSEIYGKGTTTALQEDSDRLLGPPSVARWSYATAKAFGEDLINSYCRETGAETVIARLFNCVGPRQSGAYGMVLPRFVQQALAGVDVTVYGDGSQCRCFTHVADTVRAILLLIDSPGTIGGTYNVGSPTEISIMDLAISVIERAESLSRIALVPFDQAYGEGFEELGRRRPDISAIHHAVGWTPTRTLDEIINDVIRAERDLALAGRDTMVAPD